MELTWILSGPSEFKLNKAAIGCLEPIALVAVIEGNCLVGFDRTFAT